jgi:DNA primase
VCEGQIDTISCHEAGVENVVAPQGTALTEQHARILKRHAEEVVLMFDADAAGQNAIVRSAEPLWDEGVVIRVAVLPHGHDPDSFVKAFGAEKLRELIGKAPSCFAYLLDRLCHQYDPRTERGKLQIGRQMAEWLARIPAPILLATYAQQTAKRLDISEDALRREIAKLSGNRRGRRDLTDDDAEHEEAADISAGQPRDLPEEEMLLQAMLASQQVIELVAGALDVTWLSNSVAGKTIQQVLKLHDAGRWDGPNSLLRECERGESEQLITELQMGRWTIKNPEREAPNCLMLLQRRWLEKQVHDNRRQQQLTALPPDKMATLLKQFVDLDSKLRHIDALLRGE